MGFHVLCATLIDGFGISCGFLSEVFEDGFVFGVAGEVVVFSRVFFEVEEHFEFGRTVLEVDVGLEEVDDAIVHADVFPGLVADAFLEGIVTEREEAFEEEFVSPGDVFAFDERSETSSFHFGWRFDLCVVEDGFGVVEAGDELIELTSSEFFGCFGIVDDAGDFGGEVEEEFFAAEAVLPHDEAMVAAEEDDGVFREPSLFKVIKESTDDVIEAGDGLIVADVVLFVGVEVVVVDVGLVTSSLVLIEDEFGDELVRIGGCFGGDLEINVAVEGIVEGVALEFGVFVSGAGHAMPLGIVVEHRGRLRAVGNVEADGKGEGFVFGSRVEEFGHRLSHDVSDDVFFGFVVGFGAGGVVVFGEEFGPAVVGVPEVELLVGVSVKGVVFDAELSDEAGVVTSFAEEGGVGLFPLVLGELIRGAEANAVDAFGHAGEVGDAAG